MLNLHANSERLNCIIVVEQTEQILKTCSVCFTIGFQKYFKKSKLTFLGWSLIGIEGKLKPILAMCLIVVKNTKNAKTYKYPKQYIQFQLQHLKH